MTGLMTMPRIVAAEVLDTLAADDPAALRSRRDLQRVHRMMRTRAILRKALHVSMASRGDKAPLRVLELGAGDGSLMLGVARDLAPKWPPVELTLLDRQDLVDDETIKRYGELGWTAVPNIVDVFDWAAETASPLPEGKATARWDLIVANLFLHHFEGVQLAALLGAVTVRSDRFFACEPRRDWLALAGSHLAGVIGAGAVTREDAVLSVHAGFREREITALWPANGDEWRVHEHSAGLFSHCFRAERIERIEAI
jgi:hypothetical protein